jgi:iron complex transport system substrate-binding protein
MKVRGFPLALSAWVLVSVASLAAQGAERIVSTAPGFTELLFELGGGGKIVAVSDYCDYPEAARSKTRIGGPFNLNFEQIVALRADLIILPKSLDGAADKCRSLGLRVLQLPNERVGDLLESVERLGEVIGRSAEAERLATEIRYQLNGAKEATRHLPRVKTLVVVLRAAGTLQDLTVASPDTFLDELLETAGGENVIRTTLARYPRISKEEIIALDPEVILDLTFTADGEDTVAIWSQLPTLAAVRKGRVVALADPAITIPGPRMVQTLRRFIEILHPEAALP